MLHRAKSTAPGSAAAAQGRRRPHDWTFSGSFCRLSPALTPPPASVSPPVWTNSPNPSSSPRVSGCGPRPQSSGTFDVFSLTGPSILVATHRKTLFVEKMVKQKHSICSRLNVSNIKFPHEFLREKHRIMTDNRERNYQFSQVTVFLLSSERKAYIIPSSLN